MHCLIPYKCTIDVKLRWFQYRILNRVLTTNTLLYKINQRNNNLCTFCNEEPETIKHIFTEYKKVMPIWVQLQNWFLQKIGLSVTLNQNLILFGTDLKKSNHAVNLIIILTKFYIGEDVKIHRSPFTLFKRKSKIIIIWKARFICLNYQLYQRKWQVWKGLFI